MLCATPGVKNWLILALALKPFHYQTTSRTHLRLKPCKKEGGRLREKEAPNIHCLGAEFLELVLITLGPLWLYLEMLRTVAGSTTANSRRDSRIMIEIL